MTLNIRATNLEWFLTCPRKYKFAPESDPDKLCFTFGTALHLLVESWVMWVLNDYAMNLIVAQFPDKEQRVLRAQVNCFLEHLKEKNYEFITSEYKMTHRYPFQDVILEWTFDLLFRDKDTNEIVIVDIKTASKERDEEHINWVHQKEIYPELVYQTLGLKVNRFEYWIMKKVLKPQVQEVVHHVKDNNSEIVEEFITRFKQADEDMDYPDTFQNYTCFFCPLYKQCKAEHLD